jgi:tetrathionate reductase subunit B
MDRRKFLKTGAAISAGTACICGLPVMSAFGQESEESAAKWGMVIDLKKCAREQGCTKCMDACRKENNVAYHNDPRWDIYWIRKVTIKNKEVPGLEKTVPLLCNHCDKPPCALVCPVQATYKRADGIVIVDHHRCIGCRYCVVACPYNARFFNYRENPDWPNREYPKRSHGVAESCNFCAHLVDGGELPACVQACPQKALQFGNLNDKDSDIIDVISKNPVRRLREGLGTEPKVYYIGL